MASLAPDASPAPELWSASTPSHSSPSSSDAAAPSFKKKHVCAVCAKSFTTSGHLSRHTRVHTGERNHKCPFPGCETRCSRQDNLQQHYRIHLSPGSRRTSASSARSSLSQSVMSINASSAGVRKRSVKAVEPTARASSNSPPSTPPPLEHAFISGPPELTSSLLYVSPGLAVAVSDPRRSQETHRFPFESGSVAIPIPGQAHHAHHSSYGSSSSHESYQSSDSFGFPSSAPSGLASYGGYPSSAGSMFSNDLLGQSQPQMTYPPPRQIMGTRISQASLRMSHSNSPSPVPSISSQSSSASTGFYDGMHGDSLRSQQQQHQLEAAFASQGFPSYPERLEQPPALASAYAPQNSLDNHPTSSWLGIPGGNNTRLMRA